MKRSEISEEIRYVFECPKCGELNEQCEDPEDETTVLCDFCTQEIEIED